ncbi:PAS domain-containing protein, partial [Calditerrivibrio sp.]
HPHESVEVVNKIIESFKKGEKNHAFFWIPYKNKFLFIQYYAVVNEKGEYKGIVEVTQDISEIQKITGVKRLLDW